MDSLRNLYSWFNRGPQVTIHAALAIIVLCAYMAMAYTTLSSYGAMDVAVRTLVLVFVSVLLLFTLAFVASQLLHRLDIADGTWPLGILLAACTSFGLNSHGLSLGWNVQTLTVALVAFWAVRLAVHIGARLLRTSQDARYTALQRTWRRAPSLQAFVRIFLVQALFATLVSVAVICVNVAAPEVIGPVAFMGLVVWCVGYAFEAIGDYQLASHRRRSKSLMKTGVWRYTRHPNYFGESMQWWGIAIIALGVPFGWLGVISPLVITYLLLYVSGVPLAEKSLAKKPGWKQYARQTSVFLPLPPRKP